MIIPYLAFNGNCEEAFELYKLAFNGKNMLARKFENLAPKPEMAEQIMHVEMDLDDFGRISGGDSPKPVAKGSSLSTILRASGDKISAAWEILSKDGTVIAALEPFEYENNTLMGTLTDKYGFTWIFTEL